MVLSSSTNGLGDVLFLTAVAKAVKDATVQLPTHAKRFSILFDKLAKVEIIGEQDLRPIPDIGSGHYVRRKLRGIFGEAAESMCVRPVVLHTNPESEIWAREYLSDKPFPSIFVPTCSPRWKSTRNIPIHLANAIYKKMQDTGRTPIVCQSSSNFLDIGEHQLVDLDLSKYICLCRQVAESFTANTGDEHLMTAVGGKTFVYQPADHSLFNHAEWNYSHPNSTYFTWPVS